MGTRTSAVGLLAAAAILACSATMPAAPGGTTKLVFDSGVKYTPMKVCAGAKVLSFKGSSGRITIGETTRGVAAAFHPTRGSRIGLDCNGDGELSSKEWVPVGRNHMASFKLSLDAGTGDAGKYAIAMARISILVTANSVRSVYARYFAACSRKGAIEGVPVRIVDDNLDGRYTQDGKDAIATGGTSAALPLKKVHRVGKQFYRLEVAEDGSEIAYTRMDDVALGVVGLPFQTAALKCLILESPEAAFDVKVCGAYGIPEGEYKLNYGVIAVGNEMVTLEPTRQALSYPIKGGHRNVVRMGPRLRMSFGAAYSKGKITVTPSVHIVGAGGEEYAMDYSSGIIGRPKVAFLEGGRVLATGTMSYG